MSFMELYSLTTGLIGQSGRRGALMLTIDVKHPDVKHFLKVKKTPNIPLFIRVSNCATIEWE